MRFLKVIIIIALIIPLFSFAQQPLETDYPQITDSAPSTTETSLPQYIKYVFTFIVAVLGIIALSSLILAGIKYVNSYGNPAKLSEAKSQMLSSFWGSLMLLGSFVLLQIINPNLTQLEVSPVVEIPAQSLPATPITPVPTEDLLTRIKIFSEAAKDTAQTIKKTAEDIKKATDKCDCKNSNSICACEGLKLKCQPKICYGNPCPDENNIELLQKKIIDQRDVILYYKSRAEMEKNDLKRDIEDFINKKLEWFNSEINAAKDNQRVADFLEERKGWLEEEKQYKNQLLSKMEELAKALSEAKEPPEKLTSSVSQCFINVKEKCQANCKQGNNNGCHDKLDGCQPDKCSGGNPCPTEEISKEANKIQALSPKIDGICNEIISIIDNIQKQRTPQINL